MFKKLNISGIIMAYVLLILFWDLKAAQVDIIISKKTTCYTCKLCLRVLKGLNNFNQHIRQVIKEKEILYAHIVLGLFLEEVTGISMLMQNIVEKTIDQTVLS